MFGVASQQSSWLQLAVWFGVFLAIFYFFIILPNKKKEKKHAETVDSLSIPIISPIGVDKNGEVARIKDESLFIRVSDNTEIEVLKKAIGYKVEE